MPDTFDGMPSSDGLSLFTAQFATFNLVSPDDPEIQTQQANRGPSPTKFQVMAPQTFTLPFQMQFPSMSLFPQPGQTDNLIKLTATIDISDKMPFLPTNDATLRHFDADVLLALTATNPNPFFRTSVLLADNTVNPANCSHDLVLFSATSRRNQTPVRASTGHAPFDSVPVFKIDTNTLNLEADDSAFAFEYLQDVLAWLNKYYTNGGSGATADPFNGAVIPQNTSDVVQPSVATTRTPYLINDGTQQVRSRNYHFAIARVRISGVFGDPNSFTPANSTEVYFRHCLLGSNDLSFDEDARYSTNRIGARFPLPAAGINFPLFADKISSPDLVPNSSNVNVQIGGVNGQDLRAPNAFETNSLSGKWYFYDCYVDWLDNFGGMLPTQEEEYTFSLVAQIDFGAASIIKGEDPLSSAKLARRDIVWITN